MPKSKQEQPQGTISRIWDHADKLYELGLIDVGERGVVVDGTLDAVDLYYRGLWFREAKKGAKKNIERCQKVQKRMIDVAQTIVTTKIPDFKRAKIAAAIRTIHEAAQQFEAATEGYKPRAKEGKAKADKTPYSQNRFFVDALAETFEKVSGRNPHALVYNKDQERRRGRLIWEKFVRGLFLAALPDEKPPSRGFIKTPPDI